MDDGVLPRSLNEEENVVAVGAASQSASASAEQRMLAAKICLHLGLKRGDLFREDGLPRLEPLRRIGFRHCEWFRGAA